MNQSPTVRWITVALLASSLACSRRSQEPGDSTSSTPSAQEKKEVTTDSANKGAEKPKPEAIPAPEDVAAPPADAEKTASGLASKVLTKGTGTTHPGPTDTVSVHYTGWTKDGKMFDSSVVRGQPTSFPLNRVIKGWTEGVQLMVEGEKRRFWIPAELAYGETPMGGRPAGQLTFDIELLKVPPAAPKDVAVPPPGAKKTASGLVYIELSPGKADGKKPTEESTVTVHYSGWTKDGKLFDSSVTRGEPASFPLNGVIRGWTEGLQLMKQGAKFRFWIPADLAYGETPPRPGMPSGQLTFDVELLDVS
ncbi:MAG: peptidylprolyl isomerase [Sorangiineae bacterium NIC37A_2]|jgi:FKBP-type peptidyl-prolyl cis-trans isomerase|nr:MAG: peptidylprolyl isomerase [Sorangiineae bacterium NIC37A_2]